MTGSLLSSADARLGDLRSRAYVPFSGVPRCVLLVLNDGRWIPGVRIEIASYSLTISAVSNAITTAYTLRCFDAIAGVVASHPISAAEQTYLDALGDGSETTPSLANGTESSSSLPATHWCADPPSALTEAVDPTQPMPDSLQAGIEAARAVAEYAYIPESRFPVGAVVVHDDRIAVPGVNVEHPDWARILCAERNALSTAYAYGFTNCTALYLSCPKARRGSPCGACRQVLAERAGDATIYMDRHDAPPEETTPAALLPAFFNSSDLLTE